jgi:hypothetical protein
MTFLASDVFEGARSPFLNDAGANLYTDAVLLPHLKVANEELEQILLIGGSPVQRVVDAIISAPVGTTNISIAGNPPLPDDFLIPQSLHERTAGDTAQSWYEMTPKNFEPENQVPTTSFIYYAFRNNAIYFPAATVDREILLKYDRQLAVVVGANSPIDFYLAKRFLCARVAELAARYTGQNPAYADQIMIRDVLPRKDDIERIYILQGQTVRSRRPRFTVKRNIASR